MADNTALVARVRAYLEDEVDSDDRADLESLLDQDDTDALTERFSGPLQFGTAGIRGFIGAGESRMNRAVVIRVTYGVAQYLVETVPGAAERGIVLARDARHRSDAFQRDAAAVAAALGIRVHWMEGDNPTPLLAYAVRKTNAAAGVMITASHNPPDYNGYKVYWDNGAQIIPPTDAGIAAKIAAAPGAKHIARAEDSPLVQQLEGVSDDYSEAVTKLRLLPSPPASSLRIAYSALHGVGQQTFVDTMTRCGFEHIYPVEQQGEPDGDFPTVNFPNPEEPGALDLVLEEAKRHECDLVLVNDPDADRLGVATRERDGNYVVLGGNEIGALLGHHVLTHTKAEDPLVISTVVSSRILSTMASELDARYEDTLTGFKWIANEGMRLERDHGCTFVFGFEEALGYTVGTVVRDKDGISAAVVMAELAEALAEKGESLVDELRRIRKRFGNFQSRSKGVTLDGSDGAARIADGMERLRSRSMDRIAAESVTAFRDLSKDERMASNVLLYDLADGGRVAVRPSGTEPKIKFYLEVVGENAEARLAAMEAELLRLALD